MWTSRWSGVVSLEIKLVDVEDDRCRERKKEERRAAGLSLLPAPSTGHRLHGSAVFFLGEEQA